MSRTVNSLFLNFTARFTSGSGFTLSIAAVSVERISLEDLLP
jgi:hypothetical protein